MSHKRFIACLGAALLLSPLTAQASGACANSVEMAALNSRVLQSDLMVAALACQQKTQYNAFVRKYQSELVDRGETLQGYFKRVHGGSSTQQLNRFVTSLANDSSQHSLNSSEKDFCRKSLAVFTAALEKGHKNLSDAISDASYPARHGVRPCDTQVASKN